MSDIGTFTVEGVVYKGELLGGASSHRPEHNHPGDFLSPGQYDGKRKKRCQACRWEVAEIYGVDDDDDSYVVYVVGHSIVPGEVPYVKNVHTSSIYTVLETLIVRNQNGTFLPEPARIALAEAAQHDDGMESLYRNLPKDLM